jgi:phosphatidate cytidylyltransferase
MSNFLKRVLTGIIAGSVVITAIVLTQWGAMFFSALVSFLGLHEFYRITGLKSKVAKWFLIVMAAVVWYYWAWEAFAPHPWGHFPTPFYFRLNLHGFIGMIAALAAVLLLFEKQVEQPAQEMGLMAFGYIYVLVPMGLLFQLTVSTKSSSIGSDDYHFQTILGVLLINWFLDSFAYFGGRLYGKHKLWERISPKKTWEGALTGAAFCVGLSCVFEFWLWPMDFSWIVVGAIIAVFSQLGDLVESMYKRGLQIKDSGGILPGHGGILDRMDGILISTPLIYLYIQWTNWN